MAGNALQQLVGPQYPQDQMSATKPKNALAALLAKYGKSADDFLRAPGGYANPPYQMISSALGIPGALNTVDRIGYGEPLTTGKGQTTRMRDDTVDALGFVPMSPKAALAVVSGGMHGAMGAEHAIFAGVNAKTADKAALATAQKAIDSGADPRKVWTETGWFKGGDGKWRFEIDDSGAMFNPSTVGGVKRENDITTGLVGFDLGPTVGGLIEHPLLKHAYPDGITKSTFIGNKNTMFGDGVQGSFDGEKSIITINAPAKAEDARSLTLHELQHGVQKREGFASGGSPEMFGAAQKEYSELVKSSNRQQDAYMRAKEDPSKIDPETGLSLKSISANLDEISKRVSAIKSSKSWGLDPFDAYRNLAGEAEARAVQSRMKMNPLQRAATYPLDSYDVPLDSLIYR